MGAIIGIIAALAAGGSVTSVLAALSISQWVEIAGIMVGAAPKLRQAFIAIHPALEVLGVAINSELSALEAGTIGSKGFADWLAANNEAAIQLQGSDS